jgi:hypothetical protein
LYTANLVYRKVIWILIYKCSTWFSAPIADSMLADPLVVHTSLL